MKIHQVKNYVKRWPQTLHTRADVARWFRRLWRVDGIVFHPDDTGDAYVDIETGRPTMDAASVEKFNTLMDQAFDLLGYEVYEVACEVTMEEQP